MAKESKTKSMTQELLKAFETKDEVVMKKYVKLISKEHSAQKAAMKTLIQCLVHHNSTPVGILYSLHFFKLLLLESELDLLQSDAIYKAGVHKSIYKICQHNKNEELQKRGCTYFTTHLKLQATPEIEQAGKEFVILALQIIQSWSQWYAIDYFSEEQSTYKKCYGKLKSNSVEFPKKQNHIFLKQKQKLIFEKNYALWKKRMDEEDEQQEVKQKIEKKEASEKKNIVQPQIAKNQLKKSKKLPQEIDEKKKISQQKKIDGATKQTDKKKVQNTSQKKKQVQNQLKSNESTQFVHLGNVKTKIQTEKQNNHTQQIQQIKIPTKEQGFIIDSSKQKNTKTLKQEQNPKNQKKKENKSSQKNQLVEKVKIQQQKTSMSKQLQNGQNPSSQKKKTVEASSNFILDKKKSNQEAKIVNLIQQNEVEKKKRKMFRTQKPKNQSLEKQQQVNSFQILKYKKKSIPKTEKRGFKTTGFPFQLSQKLNNTTLSNFRSVKRKKYPNQEVCQFQSASANYLMKIIEKARLDEVSVPFVPEYFSPIHRKMDFFLDECRRLENKPSKIFYEDREIRARLIKNSKKNQYILCIENKTPGSLRIRYSQYLQENYGDEFSELVKFEKNERRGGEKDVQWIIESLEYLDIKFGFHIVNPNFKFLQFCINIEGNIRVLSLPITLLDQAMMFKNIDSDLLSQYFEQSGSIIKSSRIPLPQQLPQFFLSNRSRDTRIKGQCSLIFPMNGYKKCILNVILRCLSRQKNQNQILVLFNKKQPRSQDFAKVVLQFMYLLL